MDGIIYIYCLKHPLTKEIRYIGKTNNLSKRLIKHLSDSKRRKTPVYNWISKLLKNNLTPEIEELLQTDIKNWPNEEIRIISEYKSNGFRLLNLALGGDEPFCDLKTRQNNGRKVASLIHLDPNKKRLWYLKKELMSYIKKLKLSNRDEEYSKWVFKINNSKISHLFNI